MGCCARCMNELGAFTCSMILIAVNLIDFTFSILLLTTSLYGVWGNAAAGIVVMSYSAFMMVFVVFAGGLGVMLQPGRRFLTTSGVSCLVCMNIELFLACFLAIKNRAFFDDVVDLDKDAKTGQDVYWLLGNAALLAVLGSRHLIRYIMTIGLRSTRDSIFKSSASSAADDDENTLNDRLIAREIRRERRDELRAHYNQKYFDGGKTAESGDTPTASLVRTTTTTTDGGATTNSTTRNELPSYVLAHHGDTTSPDPDWV